MSINSFFYNNKLYVNRTSRRKNSFYKVMQSGIDPRCIASLPKNQAHAVSSTGSFD